MSTLTQASSILSFLKGKGWETPLREIYEAFPEYPKPSIRRAIYGLRDGGIIKRAVTYERTKEGIIEKALRGVYRYIFPEELEERIIEEEEEEEEIEEEEWMYRQTVAVRCVVHKEYFNVVAHYYGESAADAEKHIPDLMELILKKAHKVSGYHRSEVSDFLISDVEKIYLDDKLLGKNEVEEEWEL